MATSQPQQQRRPAPSRKSSATPTFDTSPSSTYSSRSGSVSGEDSSSFQSDGEDSDGFEEAELLPDPDTPEEPFVVPLPVTVPPLSSSSSSSSLSSGPVKPKNLEGYLLKQGPAESRLKKRWHKRWFRCDQTLLSYFKLPTDKHCKGTISLCEVTNLVQREDMTFQIIIPTRIFNIRAPSETSLRYWVSGLSAIFDVIRGGLPFQSVVETALVRKSARNSELQLTRVSSMSSQVRPPSIMPDTPIVPLSTEEEFGSTSSSSSASSSSSSSPETSHPKPEGRQRVAKELRDTEKYFLQTITTAVDQYRPQLLNGLKENDRKDVNTLFNHLDDIKRCSQKILTSIETVLSSWSDEKSEIAPLFSNPEELFSSYLLFGSNFPSLQSTLDRLSTTNDEFVGLIDRIYQSSNLSVRLPDILFSPMQRIPRYKLLLLDIFQNTPEGHVDGEALSRAVTEIDQFTQNLNEELKKASVNHAFLLKNKGANKVITRAGDGTLKRFLIADDVFHEDRLGKKVHVYLFNDSLIAKLEAKVKTHEITESARGWPLNLIWFKRPKDPSFASKNGYGFMFACPEFRFMFRTPSEEARTAFCDQLDRAISDFVKKNPVDPAEKEKAAITCETIEGESERFGKYTYDNGNKYEGWWKFGSKEGPGRLSFQGSEYVGMFENNQKNGRGVLYYSTGDLYEGMWRDDLSEGKGVLKWITGDKYIGDFVAGKRNGRGEMIYSSGDRYVGQWRDNLPHGQGEFFSTSSHYSGSWKLGQRDGEGRMEKNGDVYEGQFVKGMQEGKGKMVYGSDGSEYEGEWKANLRHGSGTLRSSDGVEVYTGEWSSGQRSNKGKQVFRNGDIYDGEWNSDQFHGKGSMIFGSGNLTGYSGEWQKGLFHGKGIASFSNKMQFDGSWKRGIMHGSGTLSYPKGLPMIEGRWKHNSLEGKCTVTIEGKSPCQGIIRHGVVYSSTEVPLVYVAEIPFF